MSFFNSEGHGHGTQKDSTDMEQGLALTDPATSPAFFTPSDSNESPTTKRIPDTGTSSVVSGSTFENAGDSLTYYMNSGEREGNKLAKQHDGKCEQNCLRTLDGIFSCGAGFQHYEVSPILANDARVRNHFAAKMLGVVAIEILISAIISSTVIKRFLLYQNISELFNWLALIPCILYAIIFITFRVLQLSRKSPINWIVTTLLFCLLITSLSLMFPIYYCTYWLGSISITYIILGLLLFTSCVDLFEPAYKLYLIAGGISTATSIVAVLLFHLMFEISYDMEWYFFTETFVVVISATLLASLITVYELRKMISGRRMPINETEFIVAAILL